MGGGAVANDIIDHVTCYETGFLNVLTQHNHKLEGVVWG